MKKKILFVGMFLLLVPLAALAQATNINSNPGFTTAATPSSPSVTQSAAIPTNPGLDASQLNPSQSTTAQATSLQNGQQLVNQNGTVTTIGNSRASAPAASTPTCAGGSSGGFCPLAPIPGLTSATSSVTSTTIAGFLSNLYTYLIGIAAILAVVEIIRGGILIMGESVSGKGKGKEVIQQAIVGLVLVLAPVLVFTIINPAILNLSLDLPPISVQSISQQPSPIVSSATQQVGSGANTANFTGNEMLCPAGAGGVGQNCTGTESYCTNQSAGGTMWTALLYCESATNPTVSGTDTPASNNPTYSCPAGQQLVVNCENMSSNSTGL